MKHNTFTKLMAVGAVSAIALSTAFAQVTTTKETTTTSTGTGVSATTTTTGATLDATGTITTYSPDAEFVTVRTTSSAEPVKYYWDENVTIVDVAGQPVERKYLRADLPVKYTYVKRGDRMVVSKITVQKPITEIKETVTTTTTTTR
jgi:histidinol-phosphate/aromatic aminotransferase/cobyric acid decarboxylase-like protein